MIKLVVTDIDGTLLPEGTDHLNPELFEVIRALKENGIQFAVGSGRQYMSMRYLFQPVLDDVIFIAENGSNVMYQGKRSLEQLYGSGAGKSSGTVPADLRWLYDGALRTGVHVCGTEK